MSSQNRNTLKSYFKENSFPTEQSFADLIDSFINQQEDEITVSASRNVRIGNPKNDTSLALGARWSKLTGTVSAEANLAKLKGEGTSFLQQLKDSKEILIGSRVYRIKNIVSESSLEVEEAFTAELKPTDAYYRPDIFSIEDASGKVLFYISRQGWIGVNKIPVKNEANPADVQIAGTLQADRFSGNGEGLTDVSAASIKGIIPEKNLPPQVIPGNIDGLLTIKSTYDQALPGRVTGVSGTRQLTGTGTDFSGLSANQSVQVAARLYKIVSIAGNILTLSDALAAEVKDEKIYVAGDFLSLENGADQLLNVNGKGDLETKGAIRASNFIGDGSALNNLKVSVFDGRLKPENMPEVLSGLTVKATRLAPVALTGTVSIATDTDTVTGKGTLFTKELKVSQTIGIDAEKYQIDAIESDTALTLIKNVNVDVADAQATTEPNALYIEDADGKVVFYITQEGFVQAIGTMQATSFSGDGSGLSNLDASQLNGRILSDNLPSDMQVSGSLAVVQNEGNNLNLFTVKDHANKPVLDISYKGDLEAKGAISATSFTGDGSALTNVSASAIQGDLTTGGTITAAKFSGDGSGLTNISPAAITGDLTTEGTVTAAHFVGNGAQLTNLTGAQLKGDMNTGGSIVAYSLAAQTNITAPSVSADKISSAHFTGNGSGLTDVTASAISGDLTTEGTITAAKFTGDGSGLTNISPAAITGDLTTEGTVTAAHFVGNGAQLTNLTGAQLKGDMNTGGSIVAYSLAAQTDITAPSISADQISSAHFTGNGSGLTDVTASAISGDLTTEGTITAAKFSGDGSGLTNVLASAITGDFSTTGTITAGHFNGSGFGLTDVTASAIKGDLQTSGTISASHFRGDGSGLTNISVSTVPGDLNTPGTITAGHFAGDGARLTNVTASAIKGDLHTDGWITAARFTGNGSGLTDVTATAIRGDLQTDGKIIAGHFKGDGSSLTNIAASAIKGDLDTNGVVNASRFIGDGSGLRNVTASAITGDLKTGGAITAARFVGDGSGLANVIASGITGDVSTPGNIKASRFIGDGSQLTNLPAASAKQMIQLYAEPAVLMNDDPARLSWEGTDVDELLLEYFDGGQYFRLSTMNRLKMSEPMYLVDVYKDTVFTMTAFKNRQRVAQKQVAVTVLQTPWQYAQQLRHESRSFDYLISQLAGRFTSGKPNKEDVMLIGRVLANMRDYTYRSIIEGMERYYKTHGYSWTTDNEHEALDMMCKKITKEIPGSITSNNTNHFRSVELRDINGPGEVVKIKVEALGTDQGYEGTGGSSWGIDVKRNGSTLNGFAAVFDNPSHKPANLQAEFYVDSNMILQGNDKVVINTAQIYGGHTLTLSNIRVTLWIALQPM